ncbi:MAG TPA: phosphoribosyltransferase family protein [Fimbriimonadaceae bacterium]|nr:phosphoribosyltransferase family protein [Fimbriimonadaceae bacterium]
MDRFRDRFDAGRKLAASLRHLRAGRPVILGLARGGVEVASEVARSLCAPLDVLVARKVGAPSNPEYGIGAVAPEGIVAFDEDAVRRLEIEPEELSRITEHERTEVMRRLKAYRGDRPLEIQGKNVILVDDGLATGITALAAVRYVRSLAPAKIVFAVPVTSSQGAELVGPEVDEFVTLATPALFYAVGAWYEDFSQTTDDEVVELLRKNAAQGYLS